MDDKTKTGSPDSKFINVNEDYEVAYWTKEWDIVSSSISGFTSM
jgi:endo-alpha-1,4-polygalactosaminidase (GH114 family)